MLNFTWLNIIFSLTICFLERYFYICYAHTVCVRMCMEVCTVCSAYTDKNRKYWEDAIAGTFKRRNIFFKNLIRLCRNMETNLETFQNVSSGFFLCMQ